MMTETIIAANWKMHKTTGQASEFACGLRDALRTKPAPATVVVAPPFTSIKSLAGELNGSGILLAAQNIYPAARGAFTGEISGEMLVDAGCRFCIIGHSERRRLFGEDNALINAKIIVALSFGLRPIFCVGETLAEREARITFNVLAGQL
ncbi:MAG TPA: triose-phosphate isomerase, partial [Smithellaceae bacterium]|nr:triose-phosphate isomerase [Smithellaceae bacterium]